MLQEGIDSFIKSLRKLPKNVRVLPVALFLDGRMKEFRESLPLLMDLKNEALRDRLVWKFIPKPTESNKNKRGIFFKYESIIYINMVNFIQNR